MGYAPVNYLPLQRDSRPGGIRGGALHNGFMRWMRGAELQNIFAGLVQGDTRTGIELETAVFPAWDAAACNLHAGRTFQGEVSASTAGLVDLSTPVTEIDVNGDSSDFYSFLALFKHSLWPR